MARSGHDVWYGVWPSDCFDDFWVLTFKILSWKLASLAPIYVQVYCHLPLVCNGLRIPAVASGVGRHKPAVHLPRLFLSCQTWRCGNNGSTSYASPQCIADLLLWHQLKVSQGGIAFTTFAHTHLWQMIWWYLINSHLPGWTGRVEVTFSCAIVMNYMIMFFV